MKKMTKNTPLQNDKKSGNRSSLQKKNKEHSLSGDVSKNGLDGSKIRNNGDVFKTILGLLFLIVGFILFYKLSGQFKIVSYLFPIVGLVILVVIVLFWTSYGKDLLKYIKDATDEIRKVVWPEKRTTVSMTIMVLLFVLVLSTFLWLSDTLLSWVFFDLILKRG